MKRKMSSSLHLPGAGHVVSACCLLTLLVLSGCFLLRKPEPELIPVVPPITIEEIDVEVLLLTTEGKSVPLITVTAQTRHSTASDVTGSDGKALLKVQLGTQRSIEFFFSGQSVNWLETLNQVPPGVRDVKAAFTVSASGEVRLSAVEF